MPAGRAVMSLRMHDAVAVLLSGMHWDESPYYLGGAGKWM